jgi:uncharacterized membrane protein YvlD (DUF360 family)
MVLRAVIVAVANCIGLLVADALVDGLRIESIGHALFAGVAIGLANAVIWPMLSFVVVPVSAVTFGVGSLVLSGIMVLLVVDLLPGVELDGLGASIVVLIVLAVVTAAVSSLLAVDDDAWFDRRMARRAERSRGEPTDVPGIVFVQLDGVSEDVLRRAVRSGDAPTIGRWVHDGAHRLVGWRTDWSSQTGVSQCGILHGSNDDMPAFRWVEKDTGTVMVSNHPKNAREIERRHSDGHGLMAHHGSSYGNLFSGDAERAVLTMSVVGRTKEGRIGSGYARYFSHPYHAARTLGSVVREVARERGAANDQRRRGVEPRVERSWTYAFLRAFTTVISRDVCVHGILQDVAEGRASVYVDFLGYDEVSHHSGPEREDTLGVLRDLDRQLGRIERSFRWAPRPYHLVVLSDHGQTQGATFEQRFGEPFAAVVARLAGSASTTVHPDDEGRTESSQIFRAARGDVPDEVADDSTAATVLGSGNLALVYLNARPHRLTLEEIDELHPGLVSGLVEHPGVGFVLVRTAELGSVVLGAGGRSVLATGAVDGDDPLAPFGPEAVAMVRHADGFSTCADLMVNSMFDPETEEVAAFEHQVGSHGGLGGPQTHPFLLSPTSLSEPPPEIHGPVALHRVLKGWLAEVGQPVVLTWLDEDHLGDAAEAPAV